MVCAPVLGHCQRSVEAAVARKLRKSKGCRVRLLRKWAGSEMRAPVWGSWVETVAWQGGGGVRGVAGR